MVISSAYPLVNIQKAIFSMAIEIVDLLKMVIFHGILSTFTSGYLPRHRSQALAVMDILQE